MPVFTIETQYSGYDMGVNVYEVEAEDCTEAYDKQLKRTIR